MKPVRRYALCLCAYVLENYFVACQLALSCHHTSSPRLPAEIANIWRERKASERSPSSERETSVLQQGRSLCTKLIKLLRSPLHRLLLLRVGCRILRPPNPAADAGSDERRSDDEPAAISNARHVIRFLVGTSTMWLQQEPPSRSWMGGWER